MRVRIKPPLGRTSSDTHSDSGDCGIDRGSFTDLHLVHRLLEHGTSGVRSGNDVHFDDRLRVLAALVGGLHGDAVLLAGVQFPHGLDDPGLRVDLELLQAIVRHMIDAVRYLGVLPFVVVRGLHLARGPKLIRRLDASWHSIGEAG